MVHIFCLETLERLKSDGPTTDLTVSVDREGMQVSRSKSRDVAYSRLEGKMWFGSFVMNGVEGCRLLAAFTGR